MGRWYINRGINRNMMVNLSGGPDRYQLDVYVVIRFRFFYDPPAQNWSPTEVSRWISRFRRQVYNTWSECWWLISDIDGASALDQRRRSVRLPRCAVRVHATDIDSPNIRLANNQRVYVMNVYRRAPDQGRSRQHAEGMRPSRAAVGDAGQPGTEVRGASEAEVYEDSLQLGDPSTVDGNRQVTAQHEFGHMLGLMHPNDMQTGCIADRGAPYCYGAPGSVGSSGIMGRGMRVLPEHYQPFLYIVSRLLPMVDEPGWFGDQYRLAWSVSRIGQRAHAGRRADLGGVQPSSRFAARDRRPPGPIT